MEGQSNKKQLRIYLKRMLARIPQKRRTQASQALCNSLFPALLAYDHVLSFASFGYEIDTYSLNFLLSQTFRLLLPKMVGDDLKIYLVTDLKNQMIATSFGLLEPNPEICKEVSKNVLSIVLVPALSFDKRNYRLGYGKGFYDRFLKTLPDVCSIGIGFKEQLHEKPLPIEPYDVFLQKVSLF